ncbi:metallophosphoesterase family protein [Peptoniphilus catoniae]|uniref:metallophosphoesterase family protein n=1 Tax=Peptoniphilus catoniae TaxID=1660341 RepID=UPI0010FEB8E0|nr:metallophosphoesterase [Peptoniphilus catoniae]
MKFLYFTDTHIRATSPKNRLDDFLQTLKNKINEVADISIRENVDFVLHGGDLFDRPDTPIALVADFSKIFRKFKAPIYIISGNHDIFGHNSKTLNRSMLGLLNSFNVVNLVNDKKIILEKDGIKVQLTGYPYSVGMDNPENRENYIVKEKNPNVDYMIHMTHGFLIDKPFIRGVSHTLISEILDTKADITLAGHYHYGFKTQKVDDKYFINPGALIRISNSLTEIKRKPKVNIIELTDKIEIKDIYLKSALDGELVLDRSEIERHKFKSFKLDEFKEIIESTTELGNIDVYDILNNIALNESIDEKIRKEAIKRIEKQQIQEAEFY